MTTTDLDTLGLETLIVGPNDVVLLRVPSNITAETAARLGATASRVLGPGRTLIVSSGIEVLVARDARAEGNDRAG